MWKRLTWIASSLGSFNTQDLISSSPYCLPFNPYYVSSENLVLDQLIIFNFFSYSYQLSAWYCLNSVRKIKSLMGEKGLKQCSSNLTAWNEMLIIHTLAPTWQIVIKCWSCYTYWSIDMPQVCLFWEASAQGCIKNLKSALVAKVPLRCATILCINLSFEFVAILERL